MAEPKNLRAMRRTLGHEMALADLSLFAESLDHDVDPHEIVAQGRTSEQASKCPADQSDHEEYEA
jgi:hypothetical protein